MNRVIQVLHCLVDGSKSTELGNLFVVNPLQSPHLVEIFLRHFQFILPPVLLPPQVLQHFLLARQLHFPCQGLDKESHLEVELWKGTNLNGNADETHGRVIDIDEMFVEGSDSPGGYRQPALWREEREAVVVAGGQEDHGGLQSGPVHQAQPPVREAGAKARDLTDVTGEDGGERVVVVGEEDGLGVVTELQHDVRPAGPAAQYHHPLPPQLLRPPVVVAVEDLAGELVDAGDVRDDGDTVVPVADHDGVEGLHLLSL